AVAAALFLFQELGGMADRGQRIADLVRDVRGQPAERGELEALRLLLRARRVLDEQHGELLAGLHEAQAQAAAAQVELDARRRAVAGAPGAPAFAEPGQQAREFHPEQRPGAQQALRLRVVLGHPALAV